MKTLLSSTLKSASFALLLFLSLWMINDSVAIASENPVETKPDIQRITIKGNTKVILVQGKRDFITMDESDMDKVSVKQIGNTLTLNSTEAYRIVVFVHIKDIYRIVVSDQAIVQTLGKLNLKNLQVLLKDEAQARVRAITESLYTAINDKASLELIGSTDLHMYESGCMDKINTKKFAALKTKNSYPTQKTAELHSN